MLTLLIRRKGGGFNCEFARTAGTESARVSQVGVQGVSNVRYMAVAGFGALSREFLFEDCMRIFLGGASLRR